MMRTTPSIRLVLAASLASVLVACGGEGTAESTPGAAAIAGTTPWSTDVPASQKQRLAGELSAATPKATDDAPADSATGEGSSADESPTSEADPIAATAASDSGGPAGAAPGSYGDVTFNEEWDGPLDDNRWNTRLPHWSSQDLDNWSIENGLLRIWTPHDENGQFEFNNRAMNTEGKYSQRYGWFEMEARLPTGVSLWPSFWLYGIYGTKRPEIDIMESFAGVDQWWGDPNPIDYGATVWMSDIHDGSERIGERRPGHYGLANFDLTRRFHKYGVKWEPDGITFFFDGQQIGDKIFTQAFDMELFIIVAMGTGRVGDYNGPNSRTPTDSEFDVNYVRAWALPSGTTVNGKRIGR